MPGSQSPVLLLDAATECGLQCLSLHDKLKDHRILGNAEQFVTQMPAEAEGKPHEGGGQVLVQTGPRQQSGRIRGRLASTCPEKEDSRHQRQQIAAMWGGGPSAAGSSKFSKEAKNFDFM